MLNSIRRAEYVGDWLDAMHTQLFHTAVSSFINAVSRLFEIPIENISKTDNKKQIENRKGERKFENCILEQCAREGWGYMQSGSSCSNERIAFSKEISSF